MGDGRCNGIGQPRSILPAQQRSGQLSSAPVQMATLGPLWEFRRNPEATRRLISVESGKCHDPCECCRAAARAIAMAYVQLVSRLPRASSAFRCRCLLARPAFPTRAARTPRGGIASVVRPVVGLCPHASEAQRHWNRSAILASGPSHQHDRLFLME